MFFFSVGDLIIEGLVRSRESGFRAPEKLSELLAKIRSSSRLMVIGGKSSGKSSQGLKFHYIKNRSFI